MAFKDWLRRNRQDAGLTQRELGERIGKSKQLVSFWESGVNPSTNGTIIPAPEDIQKIVKEFRKEGLHVTVEDAYEEAKLSHPPDEPAINAEDIASYVTGIEDQLQSLKNFIGLREEQPSIEPYLGDDTDDLPPEVQPFAAYGQVLAGASPDGEDPELEQIMRQLGAHFILFIKDEALLKLNLGKRLAFIRITKDPKGGYLFFIRSGSGVSPVERVEEGEELVAILVARGTLDVQKS